MKMKVSLIVLGLMSFLMATTYTISSLGNATTYITFGDCYNITIDENWQMFCVPSYPKLNQSISLDYDNSFVNNDLNITVIAPQYPKLNLTRNLLYGETYTNSILNLTVSAQSYPVTVATIYPNTEFRNNSMVIRCNQTLLNLNLSLDYSASYKNSDLNLNVTCSNYPTVNKKRELAIGEMLSPLEFDPRLNLTISCKYINLQEYNETKLKYDAVISENSVLKASLVERNSTISVLEGKVQTLTEEKAVLANRTVVTNVIPTLNKSCNFTQIVISNTNISYCPEDITTLCSSEEKLLGQLPQCINRLASDLTKQTETLTQQLTVCNTDKSRCESGEKTNQEAADRWSIIIVGIVAAIGGGWLLTEYLKHKRTAEVGN